MRLRNLLERKLGRLRSVGENQDESEMPSVSSFKTKTEEI